MQCGWIAGTCDKNGKSEIRKTCKAIWPAHNLLHICDLLDNIRCDPMPCLSHPVHSFPRLILGAIVAASRGNQRAVERIHEKPMGYRAAGSVPGIQPATNSSSDFLVEAATTKLHRNIECGNVHNPNQDIFGHRRNKLMIAHSRHCRPAMCARRPAYLRLRQPPEYFDVPEQPELACKHPKIFLHQHWQCYQFEPSVFQECVHEAAGRSDNQSGSGKKLRTFCRLFTSSAALERTGHGRQSFR